MSSTPPNPTLSKTVNILRRKVGEFMLIMLDLNNRGVINSCSRKQECITQLNDNMNNEKDPTYQIKDKTQEYKTQDNKTYIKYIINSKKYAGDIEFYLLNVLLYNNGFPCYFDIKVNNNTGLQDQPYGDKTSIYKMHMVLGDITGQLMETPNHFNVLIPKTMVTTLVPKTEQYDNIFNLYKIESDGDCFYSAVATWCSIYGITNDHLEHLTYNVPFEISEKHMKLHNKVPSSKTNNIPALINLKNYFKYMETASKIATHFKTKLQSTNVSFNESENITDNNEYKKYVEKGVTQNEGTHCNKYKGNKNLTQLTQ